MKVEEFIKIIDADFYAGVPDSQLKALCNYLMDRYGIDEKHHVIAANEGNATALAAGYHLATGKVPVVYMQNSGEGNIINPVASLLDEHVYGIPVIFVVGWRGEPGVHDEPQHVYQGMVTVKLLEDMGFQVMYDMQYEADDIVGSVAAKFEKEIPSYIITKDHDYLQLVNDYTRVWLIQTKQETADELHNQYVAEYGFNSKMVSIPDKAFEVTPPLCLSEYGVRPEQIPDLKGIQGDTSDNIPGVKGVSSAAMPLLARYGTMEKIYEAIEECKDAKEQKALNAMWKEELGITRSPLKAMIQYKEMALLSKDLATIRRDYEFGKSLDDFKINIDADKAKSELEKYGFKSLIDKIIF